MTPSPTSTRAASSILAARSPMSLLGWSGRSNVQRIDLYTRWSLRGLVLLLIVLGGLAALSTVTSPTAFAVVLAYAVALAAVVDRCVVAFMALWFEPGPLPWRWMAALAALVVPGIVWLVWAVEPDERFATSYMLSAAVAWALGGSRVRWVPWTAIALGAAICGISGSWMWIYGAAVSAFFVFSVQSSLWVLSVVRELDAARRTQADLAVAEERLRFSRDVHDVMGRHLSTIAVQAELAATLAERGDDRAAGRIREVRATAHEALREARALARGYRPVDLDQELEGARSLLASAGIDAETDVAGLPAAWEEPVARLVREGVTNALRHSRASHVTIRHVDGTVTLVNDGVVNDGVAAPTNADGDGSGLRTLASDAVDRGGRLTWGVEGDGEFVVRLHLTDPEGALT